MPSHPVAPPLSPTAAASLDPSGTLAQAKALALIA